MMTPIIFLSFRFPRGWLLPLPDWRLTIDTSSVRKLGKPQGKWLSTVAFNDPAERGIVDALPTVTRE